MSAKMDVYITIAENDDGTIDVPIFSSGNLLISADVLKMAKIASKYNRETSKNAVIYKATLTLKGKI